VDDSQTDAERVRRLLSGLYQVEVFFDGASAVEQLANGRQPDVLVLDWLMPGMSGLDVCRFLRSRGSGSVENVRVLLLTAQRQTAQIVEGLAAGADDYLAKPYADAEMLARVASLARSKELLERAERAEAMSRSLLEGSPDALLAWDDATRTIIFANQPAEEALGAPRAGLVGRALDEVLPDLALFRGAGRAGSIPLPDLTLNGRTYAPTARHLEGEARDTTILAMRDVTERRMAESRRLDFYSIIAHDLRGPLGAVLMRSEQIARGRHGPPPAGLVGDMRKIEASVRSMVSLINDFLDMARLESMGYELRREPVGVKRLVQDTAEELRPLLEASGLRWQLDAAGEDLWVLGDRRRLVQVINNLVGNAIKFTPAGGRVQARITSRDGEVEIAISDTGPGIAPESLTLVFQRYTRLDAGGGAGPNGSGLGLMIVREIVEAHGGRVGVESTVNVGSTFWVRLPRVDRPAGVEAVG